jgi:type IV pilus assembly protein PilV
MIFNETCMQMKTRHKQDFPSPRTQRGVGLIEVLVAVLILGVGLLGIAAMQATALRNSQSSLERSQAVMQTYSILDAMRANVAVARIGGYNLTSMTCSQPDAGTLAANDLRAWIGSIKGSLNDSACGQINCGSQDCEISVQWDDSRAGSSDETNKDTHTVITRTRL